ncbi:c-type cytochrome [Afifella pfennigii]|uniref:c-type cytochrome n=1 Tax=Afifella pfennigii TaxID=209897 RepID=UPI00068C9E58|nr:c-type cytochrome [Afifella pfennigii]
MHSPAWNTYAMAILGAVLVMYGLSFVGDVLLRTGEAETPGYVIAVPEAEPTGEETATAEAGEAAEETAAAPADAPADAGAAMPPAVAMIADASPDAGEKVAAQCRACHTFDQGGANRIGPNLWNVVGRPAAAREDFNYTDAMKGYAAEIGDWNYDHLATYLADPRGEVPGTKMIYQGVKKDADLAALLAYLRTLADEPAPLPEAQAAPAAAAEPADAAESAEPAAETQTAAAPAQTETAAESAPAAEPAQESASAPAETAETETAQTETTQTETTEPAAAEPAAEETAQAEAPAAPADAGADMPPAVAMIADASPEAGEKIVAQCRACHTFDQGGANRIGPNLWDVVGRPAAAREDFNYTDAMKNYAAEIGDWSYDHLATYLADPRGEVPGTKMIYQGVKKDADLAALLAYLRTLSDQPAPLPGQ